MKSYNQLQEENEIMRQALEPFDIIWSIAITDNIDPDSIFLSAHLVRNAAEAYNEVNKTPAGD